MSGIVLDRVTKRFEGDVVAVDDVSLTIADGEFVVFVGPSGCGKSTLLRMIAGLEEASAGSIFVGGRDVTRLQPRDRDIAMVFQNYALYPHMTVEQNLAFGLKLRKLPRREVIQRVDDAARILGLEPLLYRKPAALSGGQRQRVAIGRAIVREPQAFLMDEPLSNLDAKLRVQMRAEIARLRNRLQTTTIYVTHDQVEAMTLGDRVVVLRDGVLQQVDTPQNLFRAPTNLFVASFIGSPSMNLVLATVANGRISFGGMDLPMPPDAYVGDRREVILGIRPTDFEDARLGWRPDLPIIEVVAEVTEELGSEVLCIFSVEEPPVVTEQVVAASEGSAAESRLVHDDRASGSSTFTARLDGTSSVHVGDRVSLSVNHHAFHFFDPKTGHALRRERDEARSQASGRAGSTAPSGPADSAAG